MATKTKGKKKFSHEQYQKWGREGGSPILLSWAAHHPVKGYKVTKGTNGKKK
ncbi:hypothetical protein M0R04_08245 [Candidatus Dojkabacteria bacterium]|jgi:hypothetical protein|nr:hypothetical protein [Candidatus Dojkabacteria bacterium]